MSPSPYGSTTSPTPLLYDRLCKSSENGHQIRRFPVAITRSMCENSIVLIGHITSSSVNPLLVHTCQRLGFWLSRQVRLGLTCSTEGLTRQQQGRICAAVPETRSEERRVGKEWGSRC